jgi:hypothetical protein
MITCDVVLPDCWPESVRSAMLQVISLAHWAVTYSRSWCADSPLARVRLKGQLEHAREEICMLREEIRIKDARMTKIPARHRPFYPATERMAILELKAARGWNTEQTASAFLLEADTIRSWKRRVDEEGHRPLVQMPEPINKFPAFVTHVVNRLKVLCPAMGKRRGSRGQPLKQQLSTSGTDSVDFRQCLLDPRHMSPQAPIGLQRCTQVL